MENKLSTSTLYPPIPFKGNGKKLLVYEILITNKSTESWTVKSTGVFGNKKELLTLDEEQLQGNIRFMDRTFRMKPGEEDKSIKPDMIGILYLWLEIDPGNQVPEELLHKLELSDEKGNRHTLEHIVPVQKKEPVLLQPPLSGKYWLAGNGTSNITGHRVTILPDDNKPWIAQRYAVDWVQMNESGQFYVGDPKKNENWIYYGADLLAVADGEVALVQDGIIENTPLCEEMAIEINLQSAPGNEVMLKIGKDQFALYAHMIPGSITVKPGDKVKAGDVLGKLGNSGNSDGPHLHFHLGNRSAPLGMQGLPYHLQRFERIGRVTKDIDEMLMSGKKWNPTEGYTPEIVTNEIPMDADIVNFD